MPKLYFVVDYPGSGGVEVIVNLLEILREKNIVGTAIRLGGPGSIANSGTKLPDGTLNNIDNAIIEQSAADAIVFEGWKITDHVNEIFDSYSGAFSPVVNKLLDTDPLADKFVVVAVVEYV